MITQSQYRLGSRVRDIEEAAVDLVAQLLQPAQEVSQILVQTAAEDRIDAAEAQSGMQFAGATQRLAGIGGGYGLENVIGLFHAGMQRTRHVAAQDQELSDP